ncbi:MAG: TonB family protein [Proteobacteria bacterium]|nr:TonB family protein [Pseudomonadota bacterium]
MNDNLNVGSYLSIQPSSQFQVILPSLMVSFVLHIVLFSAFLWSPGSFFKKKINLAAINVNLVSLPQHFSEPSLPKAKSSLKEKTKQDDKQPVEKVKTAPVVTPPKPEVVPEEPVKEKVSLKKKTFKTGEVVKKPEKEVAKKQEEPSKKPTKEEKAPQKENQADSVAKALERIKQNLGDTQPDDGGQDTPYAGTGPGGGSGTVALEAMEIYLLQVKEIFNRNWIFSDQLAGRFENIEAIVVCTIMPNGNIGDVWFEKRSGNTYLDDSAYKAVLKSGPLPPLPPGITQPYTAGYVFTPSGIQ